MATVPEALDRYLFSVEDFERMAEVGIFGEDVRVELIEGEFVKMTPIGNRHQGAVNRLTAFAGRIGDNGVVAVQGPVRLGDLSMPQPDLVLLRFRSDYYASSHGRPDDILVAVEVADGSSFYDRNVKAPLYARYGIPELWIVDLSVGRLETYASPTPDGYQESRSLGPGEVVAPAAFPDLAVDVGSLFMF